jgi:hypothetical protein
LGNRAANTAQGGCAVSAAVLGSAAHAEAANSQAERKIRGVQTFKRRAVEQDDERCVGGQTGIK